MHCTCENGPVINNTDRAMAEATGMDPLYVHVFMDTWDTNADRVLMAKWDTSSQQ